MKIREMTEDDAHEVARIHTASWQHAYKGIMSDSFLLNIDTKKREENWKKGFTEGPKIIRLVLEDSGQMKAFACGFHNRHQDKLPACDCELWAIYADPKAVGLGYGHKIMDAYMYELKSRAFKNMCVWVLKDNKRARKFYEQSGGTLTDQSIFTEIGGESLEEVSYVFKL